MTLQEEKEALGEWWLKQEYYCEFVDAEDQLFSHDLIIAAIGEDLKSL